MPQRRRTFIKNTSAAALSLPFMQTARSYGRIPGANDRIRAAVVGLNGRGHFLMNVLLQMDGFEVTGLCDVDARVLSDRAARAQEAQGSMPRTEKDFRILIEDPDIDAVVIATADHVHAPFAIYAMRAGKHVYVEKPCCYNPYEGEVMIRVQRETGKQVQVGNQQRSAPTSQEAIGIIHGGGIGDAYEAKTWYANNRGTIGKGKEVPVPDWLDWDLWQGPAPRRPYRDNIIHYNWHWFWHWGTGEINNNAEHELDISLWALQKTFPEAVSSTGGRFHFDDDWEFYDTQDAVFSFDDGKTISWEGRSCNNLQPFGRGRGTIVYGSNGSILMDRNGFVQYDIDGQVKLERKEATQVDGTDTRGEDNLTVYHFQNWHDAMTRGVALSSPVDDAFHANLLCHLGNMAQEAGKRIPVNKRTGQVLDPGIKQPWRTEYEPGWELG